MTRNASGDHRARDRAIVIALVVLALAALGKSWCGSAADQYLRWCYTDVKPLFFVEHLHEGAVPYLDHAVEYPVLTGLLMWLAAIPAGANVQVFWFVTVLMLAASAVITVALLHREVGWPRTLAFAAAPTLLVSGAVNWDLPAVALATAGIVAHRRARDGLTGLLLGLGTATKLFPGLFLIPTTLAAWRLRGRRAGLTTAAAGAGTWLAVNLPVYLVAPEGWSRFLVLNRKRPMDWDATITVVTDVLALSLDTTTVNTVTAVLFAVGLAVIVGVMVRRDPAPTWHLAALPILAWFLLTNKVYSPQFSLWLLPLFALSFPGWWWLVAFGVADVAVTLTRFPYLANFVGDGIPGAWPEWPFTAALAARVVILAGLAWVGWRRSVREAGPS